MAMSGKLTPEEQIKFLGKVYGYSRKGYVFLPWVDGSATDKVSRRNSYHEGRAFKWPAERNTAMLEHIKIHDNDDVYFCPNLFEGKRRIEQNVAAETVLYADLDPVDPRKIHDYKPTYAWESSPGRFQAIWSLNSAKTGATWDNQENHRLTKVLGADPSGWDSTQLLRIPGRPNFKPEYKDDNGGEPVMGRGLMWMDGPRYTWDMFSDLPEVGSLTKDSGSSVDEAVLEGIDRHSVWARVRLKLPMRIREYMALKEVPVGADRSDVIWDISCELADVGCSAIEIVALLRPSVWNKFTNRPDELQLLLKGAVKAVNHRSEEAVEASEDEDAEPKPGITWLNDVVATRIPRPRWLIKDIWTKGGLGFISGAPKSYKSWMALDMAISITTGTPFLNQPGYTVTKAKPVLYLQEEDDIRLVMERLALITEGKAPDLFWNGQITFTGDVDENDVPTSDALVWAPPERPIPLAMHVQTGFIASDPGWQSWLDEIVQQGKFAMVVIDTLGTVAGEIDTDKSGELMTRMLKPLRVIARKNDTAICIVHHNKKAANQGGRAGQDMLGSTALHAWVECAIYARSKDAHGEIAIEREAKLAMDMSFRVKIPTMFENHMTGARQLWDPEVITDGLEQIHDAPTENRPQMNERGTAGKQLAFKMKQMGKGPFSVEDLMERLGSDSPGPIRKQLTEGQRNGYFDEVDGMWTVVAS